MSYKNAIVVVGNTGVGKSYICNQFFEFCKVDTRFKSSDSIRSVTNKLQSGTIRYNGTKYTLVDTPGFFDTSESGVPNDGPNLCKLVKALENCKKIVSLIFVYTDRFSTPHKIWFDRMKNLLGEANRGHIVLLHNKLGPPDPEMKAQNKSSTQSMINCTQEYMWFSFYPGQDQVESALDTITKFFRFKLSDIEIPELCYEKTEKGEPYKKEIARNTSDEGYMQTRKKDTSHYETRDEDLDPLETIVNILLPFVPVRRRSRQVWVNSSVEERVWVADYVTRRTVVTYVNTYKVRFDGTRDFKKRKEIKRREEIVDD